MEITTQLKQRLSDEQAWYYQAVPIAVENELLTLCTFRESVAFQSQAELELILNHSIAFQLEEKAMVDDLLIEHYRNTQGEKTVFETTTGTDELSQIVADAQRLGSSDIHIEAYTDRARIRYRVDGKLLEKYEITKESYPSLLNRIKIKANLDISEKRLPQDGRIKLTTGRGEIELRVSILPAIYGEKIVLRLLKSDAGHVDVDKVGMNTAQKQEMLEAIMKPHGILLVSGPTGSGKTTTLYSLLKTLNSVDRNIVTVEDPIEYTLSGVNQVQINSAIGLTFEKALRSILRQDPDVIMLGEIRDVETAEMAIRAALTGHLVLSTIHTNSAWGTITRLKDMGIPAYLIESTITLTAAQRLVRKLCDACKHQTHSSPDFEKYRKLPRHIQSHFVAKGCPSCYYTGYKGRHAIFEVIAMNDALRTLLRENADNIDDYLDEQKVTTLKKACIDLVEQGETTIEEVYPILIQ